MFTVSLLGFDSSSWFPIAVLEFLQTILCQAAKSVSQKFCGLAYTSVIPLLHCNNTLQLPIERALGHVHIAVTYGIDIILHSAVVPTHITHEHVLLSFQYHRRCNNSLSGFQKTVRSSFFRFGTIRWSWNLVGY